MCWWICPPKPLRKLREGHHFYINAEEIMSGGGKKREVILEVKMSFTTSALSYPNTGKPIGRDRGSEKSIELSLSQCLK